MGKDSYIVPVAALGIGLLLISSGSKAEAPAPKSNSSAPSSPTGFCKQFYPDAVKSEYETGVPALFTLAQGGLESYWGKHAPGFNFFGIKAGSTYKGKVQLLKTWECSHTNDTIITTYAPGTPGSNASCNAAHKTSYRVYGKFRAYPTPADGFIDHGEFLRDNKRYKDAFKYKNDPKAFARAIAKAGYATAPNYANVLVDTISNVEKVLKLAHSNEGGKW